MSDAKDSVIKGMMHRLHQNVLIMDYYFCILKTFDNHESGQNYGYVIAFAYDASKDYSTSFCQNAPSAVVKSCKWSEKNELCIRNKKNMTIYVFK